MKIGIIGCGSIGSCIAMRLAFEHELFLCDHSVSKMRELTKIVNGTICENLEELVNQVEMIILAVKPKDLESVSSLLVGMLTSSQILVSTLTGTSVSALKNAFGKPLIIRMMPNLAVLFGKGVVALCENVGMAPEQKANIESIFSSLGLVKWFPEAMINAITSLTGSGPAFLFALAEAMVDASIALGFGAADGKELVIQMLTGSIAMLKETGKSPAELKWQVCSPAGTTIAGLRKFEENKVRSGIIEAFVAAYERAHEIGNGK